MPVKTQELVTLACSRCERPITGDDAPAVDALTNLPVCDGCVRAQRHARRRKASEAAGRGNGVSARAWFYGQPGFHSFDTPTSPARRGDMTRDRATTQQPMQRPAEMSTAGGSVTSGTDQMPSTSSRIPDAADRVGALQPGATSRRGADNEALRGVGSAGGGPAAGDVDGSKASA